MLDADLIHMLEGKGLDFSLGLDRFDGNEDLLIKFMLRYLECDYLGQLEDALKAQDVDQAYQHAHALKGLAGNLSFTEYYKAVSSLSDRLREGMLDGVDELMLPVLAAHKNAVEALTNLKEHIQKLPQSS